MHKQIYAHIDTIRADTYILLQFENVYICTYICMYIMNVMRESGKFMKSISNDATVQMHDACFLMKSFNIFPFTRYCATS